MSTPSGCCTSCRRRVVSYGEDGLIKIRSPLVLFAKGQTRATAVCPWCREETPLDITLGASLIAASAPKRLFIRRK